MFHGNVGVFAEYRYSRLRAKYRGFDTDIDTHRVQFGATLRF
jgi:opacity protein-like surface antigen